MDSIEWLPRLAAVLVPLLLVACESPESGQNQSKRDDGPWKLDVAPSRLVERAEQLRDRSFDQPPDFSPTSGPPDVEPPPLANDRASAERDQLARILFDRKSIPEARRQTPLEVVADYDPGAHALVYDRGADTGPLFRAAVLAALVEALERQHFDSWDSASTWDRALALRAADRAAPMFVAVADALGNELGSDGTEALEQLAERPDIAPSVAPFDEILLDGTTRAGSDGDGLVHGESQFAIREGLALGATLFRSSGWTGVELLKTRPPESAADVVRPDRWMSGEGFGSWDWSPVDVSNKHPASDWNVTRSGRIGPSLTAIWLAQRIPSTAARTAFSSWRSDSYRIRRPDSDSNRWRFEWATQWKTPSGARKITRGFEQVLDTIRGDDSSVTTDVTRNGLRVLVVLETVDTADADGEPASALEDVRPTYESRTALPLDYVPTRLDDFKRKASEASREDGIWTSPEAGIRLSLDPISEWTFRRSRTPPLRWFARKSSDVVLQMSTELQSPLEPSFGSSTYLEARTKDYREGFQKVERASSDEVDGPGTQTLAFRITGTRQQKKIHLRVWQFRRGDVIVTLSLQTPSARSEGTVEEARTVLNQFEFAGAPPGADDRGNDDDSSGTIEYEIEE